MENSTTRLTPSSGNVFADLGLPNPEDRLLKAQIALHIKQMIQAQGLTQTQVAERVGLPQSNISHIVNGRLNNYSVERLLQVVSKLGHNIEVRISSQTSAEPSIAVVMT